MYLGAVQRLREFFYINGPEFENVLWRVAANKIGQEGIKVYFYDDEHRKTQKK